MKRFERTFAALWISVLAMLLTAPAVQGKEGEIFYDGAELYAMNCANCHGIYGEGDGALTPDLSVVLLDLRYLAARNGNVFPEQFVLQIIDGRETRAAHGPSGMPVWGAEFARGEGTSDAAEERVRMKIQAIVDFIASIQIVE